ncbi:Lytic transglycosylase [Planctomycetales bacterium 10988]|nr:Lytic transglycosylase [Planctomycetales bacterium 10988]
MLRRMDMQKVLLEIGWMILVIACPMNLFAAGLPEISASVGKEGENRPKDVFIVQGMLNHVPYRSGGPKEPLPIDGILGSNTIAAIERFQTIQLGFRDGLVEPEQRTIKRLQEFFLFAAQDRSGPKIAWGAQVTGPFKQKVLQVATELGLDPNHLMAAMAFETAGTFSPAIKNAAGSGATGLIQFMPSTAKGLGLTTQALQRMNAVEQMDIVKKYFLPYHQRIETLSDLYMAILYPVAIGKPEEYVLFGQEKSPRTYQMNAGLDRDGDGNVTKAEAAANVQASLDRGLQPENHG